MSSFLSKKITRISIIMSFLVVLLHSVNYLHYGYKAFSFVGIIQSFFSVTAYVAVPTFLFISGFLFFTGVTEFKTVLLKMKKRIFTVLIPYLSWNIIITLYIMVSFNMPILKKYIINDEFGALTLNNVLRGIFLYGYNGPFWYVQVLLLYISISPLLFYILKNKIISIILIILFLIPTVWCYHLSEYVRLDEFFWYFLGCFIAKNDLLKNYKKNKIISTMCLLFTVLFTLYLVFFSKIEVLSFIPGNIRFYLVNTVKVFTTWFAFDLVCGEKIFKFEYGSFFIYAGHSVCLRVIKKIFALAFKYDRRLVFIDYFGSAVVVFVFLAFLAALVKKTSFLNKVLNGGRGARQ